MLHGLTCSNEELRFGMTMKPLGRLRVIDAKSKCLIGGLIQCRYITLSYVWAKTNTLRFTRDNLLFMQTDAFFKHQRPPATIVNAMTVVEGCETYLWEDALCAI